MKKYYTLLFIAALAAVAPLQSQTESFRILDPERWNSYMGEASVTTAAMEVSPVGLMAKVDIILEIELKDKTKFYNGAQFEIVQYFTLPENCFIYDAYLWMDGGPVKAQLYEADKAKKIYEGLVNRKVDPLIIYKNDNNYELRIFPLLSSEPRKIKLSIMVPIAKKNNHNAVPDLSNLFYRWMPEGDSCLVQLKNYKTWGTPIDSHPNGYYSNTQILNEDITLTLKKTEGNGGSIFHYFKSEKEKPQLVVNYVTSNSGYFHLMDLDTQQHQSNTLMIIDVHANQSQSSFSEALKAARSVFLSTKSEKDSFNLVYGDGSKVMFLSNNWLPNTSVNWDMAVTATANTTLQDKTNTILLLNNALDSFVKTHHNNTNILLISASNPFYQSANYIENVKNKIPNKVPINCLGFNKYYYAYNDVTLKELASYSNGQFLGLYDIDRNGRYIEVAPYVQLIKLTNNTPSVSQNKQINIKSKSIVYQETKTALNNNYPLIIGKFYGKLDSIELETIIWDSTTASSTTKMVYAETESDNTMFETSWAGIYYNQLQANMDMPKIEIVQNSIKYNVLTNYTAFLALEPEFSNRMDFTVKTDKIDKSIEHAVAFPNPFHNTLKLQLSASLDLSNSAVVTIFNMQGQKVVDISIQEQQISNNTIDLSQFTEKLKAGIYIINIQVGSHTEVIKVVKQ